MNEMALAGLCLLVTVLTFWGARVLQRQRRNREWAALAREAAANDARQRREQQEQAARTEQQRLRGHRTMYRREMAQRELDRYYGRSHRDEDPSFEQWLYEHGYADEKMEG